MAGFYNLPGMGILMNEKNRWWPKASTCFFIALEGLCRSLRTNDDVVTHSLDVFHAAGNGFRLRFFCTGFGET